MARIAKLYKVEAECAEMTPTERGKHRKQCSRSVLDGIFQRLDEMKSASLPSEPLRKAIDYALNQRQALYRYLEDGRLKPDNNLAENAIRPLALGRKNWLFAASDRGAHATALYLGLIQSCKASGINPWEYFNDMLRRIMSHPVTRLRELLPDQWKPLKTKTSERDHRPANPVVSSTESGQILSSIVKEQSGKAPTVVTP